MLAVTLSLGWFSSAYLNGFRKDAELLSGLRSAGGQVHSSARKPQWLWHLFGDLFGDRVNSLILVDSDVSDSQIAELSRFRHLGGLYLDRTAVTDDGLACLSIMTDLVALSLRRTSVTELPSLSHMSKLVELDISFTNVKEVDVTGLDSLATLTLRATQLNDAGLANMSPLPELRSLDIAGAGTNMAITDDGIGHITARKFPKLRLLYLYNCEVSQREVDRLMSEFPGIEIHR